MRTPRAFESFGLAEERTANRGGVPQATHGAGGILDYPQYTRPSDFQGLIVPPVLQSGNHLTVRAWRRRMALKKTLQNRPDLLDRAALSAEDRLTLAELVIEVGGQADQDESASL